MLEIILVQGFCPLEIKFFQFPGGFRLKVTFKVFRYSFSEAIPIFFYRLKRDFILVRSL